MQAPTFVPCLQLTALPDSIGGCTSLLRLGLKGNRLVTLPASVGKLGSLVELYLTGRGSCPAAACQPAAAATRCTWRRGTADAQGS